MTHLWETKHTYYCNEGNYFATGEQHRSSGLGPRFKTFADFLSGWGDADMDYNLVFRWDWVEDEDAPHKGDQNYRDGILKLFIIGQRKGLYNWIEVEVCRADEPAVLEYLTPRLTHLMGLWSPMVSAMETV